ncbi:MAG: tripartite tricarboxylate transporter TctB family protein [Acetobacteraceae bacterium]
MSEIDRGVRARRVEIGAAAFFGAIGAAAVFDAVRIGHGWGADGPQSGTFPFWVGLILLAASLATLAGAIVSRSRAVFATREQILSVARILLPAALHVAAMHVVGLYVASAALIAWFMVTLGGYRVVTSVLAGVATMAMVFVVFETWFLVSLPKGPIEDLLGY